MKKHTSFNQRPAKCHLIECQPGSPQHNVSDNRAERGVQFKAIQFNFLALNESTSKFTICEFTTSGVDLCAAFGLAYVNSIACQYQIKRIVKAMNLSASIALTCAIPIPKLLPRRQFLLRIFFVVRVATNNSRFLPFCHISKKKNKSYYCSYSYHGSWHTFCVWPPFFVSTHLFSLHGRVVVYVESNLIFFMTSP